MIATIAGIWYLMWHPNTFDEEVLGREANALQMKQSAISEFNRAVEGVIAAKRKSYDN